MLTYRRFRWIVAAFGLAIAVAAFVLAGEPAWVGAAVGGFVTGGYLLLTARARSARWIAGGDEPVPPATLGCLLLILAALGALAAAVWFLFFH